jgi:hypothetical protein
MLKGLRKKEGLSFEDITEKLNDEGIKFGVDTEPFLTGTYFRYSILRINKDLRSAVEEMIGNGVDLRNEMGEMVFYSCFYEVISVSALQDFNGLVNFKDGKLEERTLLYYPFVYLVV